jgi:ATP-binding cassette subfamily B multidrug efflux pump
LSDEEKTSVLAEYTLVDKNSADYDTYVKEYPALENESIYVLNKIDKAEIDRLNPIMGKALLTVAGIEQAVADPAKAKEMGAAFGELDISKLPPGTDLFTMLEKLPAEQRSKIQDSVNSKFEALGESMIVQASVGAVKAEYQALGMDTAKLQNNYVLSVGGWMLVLTLLSAVCTITVGFLSARIAAGLARDLRRFTFQKVESFSSSEFEKFSTASLITRSTNDITQIQTVMMFMIRMIFYAPLIGVGGIVKVLSQDSPLAWLIIVAVLMLISLISIVMTFALPKFRIIQNLVDRLNLVSRENLSGMMVIRAFNMQKLRGKALRKGQRWT